MTDTPAPVLRLADPADSGDLLAWRNDPVTRANSRNTEAIDPDSHAAWLVRALADPARRIWVAERDGSKLGTVSAARLDAAAVELSITVAPAMRGRGAGSAMLRAAIAAALAAWPGAEIRAAVRSGNDASRRLFEGCGFVAVGESGGYLDYRRSGGRSAIRRATRARSRSTPRPSTSAIPASCMRCRRARSPASAVRAVARVSAPRLSKRPR